jgi:hypothetical protein
MARTRVVVTGLILLVAACGGADRLEPPPGGGPAAPATRDSAGVAVLTYRAGTLELAPGIPIDSIPIAVIEGSIDDPAADVTPLRPWTFLPDGRIVASDFARRRVVTFSADGLQRTEVGRRGAGPKELGTVLNVSWIGGDSLLVPDHPNGRVAIVDVAEGVLDLIPLREVLARGGSFPIAMIDGRLIAAGRYRLAEGSRETAPHLVSADFDGGDARVIYRGAAPPPVAATKADLAGSAARMATPVDIGTAQRFVRLGRGLVAAEATAWRFTLLDADGTVRRQVVVDRPRTAVTDAIWEAHLLLAFEKMVATAERPQDTVLARRQVDAAERPDSLPAWQGLHVTPGGVFWVVEQQVPGTPGWAAVAFDAEGRLFGRVASPTGDPPVLFGDDRALFRTEDELGIASWTVRPLRLPS